MIPILRSFFTKLFRLGSETGPLITSGTGDPNTNVTAPVGSLYIREDGVVSNTLYSKTSDTIADQGWEPFISGSIVSNAAQMGVATIDFGYPMVKEKTFTVNDANITVNTQIMASISGTSKDFEMDEIVLTAKRLAAGGGFTLHARSLTGRVGGTFDIVYVYRTFVPMG